MLSPLDFSPPTCLLLADPRPKLSTAVQAAVLASWQAVHASLASQLAEANLPLSFADLIVYRYCVYRTFKFDTRSTGKLLQEWFQQLTAQLGQQSQLGTWPPTQLDQACGAAWLSNRLNIDGLATSSAALLRVDEALYAEALRLQQQPGSTSRQGFFRVLRYFSLRLPASGIREHLHALLSLPLSMPSDEPQPLGLVDGAAAELLLLLKLLKLGVQQTIILTRLREGITQLLMLRRPVDFLETHYSIFPYQTLSDKEEGVFSAELSWRRGDIGQSLLLYKSYEQLQDKEILKIAELVGLNTLLRTTAPSTEVRTSQLSKGSAGLAYLYAKLHQVDGHAAYHTGHTFWLTQTCNFLQQELASGFYQCQERDLAHGLVGVGLVLLTSLTEAELGWDTLIL